MAKRETNERKREEIKAIFADLLGPKGWNRKDLAAFTGLSSSNISQYAAGKSMGTNALRAELAAVPVAKSPEATAKILAKVREYADEAAKYIGWAEDANLFREQTTKREMERAAGTSRYAKERLDLLTGPEPKKGLHFIWSDDTEEKIQAKITEEIKRYTEEYTKANDPAEITKTIEQYIAYDRENARKNAVEATKRYEALAATYKRWNPEN